MFIQATQNLWNTTKAVIAIVIGLIMILLDLWVAKFG